MIYIFGTPNHGYEPSLASSDDSESIRNEKISNTTTPEKPGPQFSVLASTVLHSSYHDCGNFTLEATNPTNRYYAFLVTGWTYDAIPLWSADTLSRDIAQNKADGNPKYTQTLNCLTLDMGSFSHAWRQLHLVEDWKFNLRQNFWLLDPGETKKLHVSHRRSIPFKIPSKSDQGAFKWKAYPVKLRVDFDYRVVDCPGFIPRLRCKTGSLCYRWDFSPRNLWKENLLYAKTCWRALKDKANSAISRREKLSSWLEIRQW